jgi:type I restriction enzyme, S subunit
MSANGDWALPPGWQRVPLGEVGEIASGVTLGRKLRDGKARRVPYLRVANVKDGHLSLSDVYEIEAIEAEIEKLRLQYGDLLLTEGGDADKLGRGTFWKEQLPLCIHQNHIFRVRFDRQRFCPEFIAAQIASPYGKAYFLAHAKQTTGIATINQKVLARFPLLVPDFTEQRRIASILSEQLAAVERARAAAEAQLEAAEALPAAYARAVFESPEANVWPRKPLREVLTLRKDVLHPSERPTGRATFVGLEHVESHTGRRIGSAELDLSRLSGRKPRFYKGDIVYGYLRPYLNKVWVAEFDGLCSVDQYVYSPSPEQADPNYLGWFMRGPIFLRRAPIHQTPGQLPRIRIEEVASVPVELPPVVEQRRIAAVLSEQMAAVEQVRAAAEVRLEIINQLPTALLQRAFAGEL